jgi:hypothetical protein
MGVLPYPDLEAKAQWYCGLSICQLMPTATL